MRSIRARLLVALIILVALISLLAAGVTYRRVLNETSTLFDYQLRQMALSLRGQISLAPRIEVPPDQGDTDFVVQIWDRVRRAHLFSRPGLPMINQTVLGYADLHLRGEPWRAYGLQTADGVIQIAQPVRVREAAGARRGGAGGHSAHTAAADHDRRGRMDRAARLAAAALSSPPRCSGAMCAACAPLAARQSAARDRSRWSANSIVCWRGCRKPSMPSAPSFPMPRTSCDRR